MRDSRYKTLTELKEALDSGALVLREEEKLIVDNDCITLYSDTPPYELLFWSYPWEVLEQALDLLEIPHQAA